MELGREGDRLVEHDLADVSARRQQHGIAVVRVSDRGLDRRRVARDPDHRRLAAVRRGHDEFGGGEDGREAADCKERA